MATISQTRTSAAARRRQGGAALNLNAIAAIAYRDLLKLLRDPGRIVATFVFPLIFIGVLGGSLQANIGANAGYNFLVFTFTGVLAQTVFQSSTIGVISLIEDRENDFSQEIFVSPISRYSIVFGKILGETLVALPQGLAILAFAFIIGVPMGLGQLLSLIVVGFFVALYGGAFGIMLLGLAPSRRAAEQLFPFILLPQYFTAGIFTPIRVLPLPLDILSKISPMRYAVDLTRGLYYAGTPEYDLTVLASPALNGAVLAGTFLLFLLIGTVLFVRAERNR